MRTRLLRAAGFALLVISPITGADEMGIGRERDIPDSEPAEPASTETAENSWQELLEWFDMDVEQ